MIVQVTETVTDHDCQRLITIYNRHAHLTDVSDHTGHPIVYWSHLQDAPDAGEIISRLVKQCLRHVNCALVPADLLYPETVILAALGSGGYHSNTPTIAGRTKQAIGCPIIHPNHPNAMRPRSIT